MIINIIAQLLFLHFVFDFVLQSDNMAKRKSKCVVTLSYHCLVYSSFAILIPFMRGVCIPWSKEGAFLIADIFILLYVTHFIIDMLSSKLTSYFWVNEKRHWFFVTIGFDQFLHSCVLLTMVVPTLLK